MVSIYFFSEGLLLFLCFYIFYYNYVSDKKYIEIYIKYKTTPPEIQSKISKTLIGLFILMMVSTLALFFYWTYNFNVPKNNTL